MKFNGVPDLIKKDLHSIQRYDIIIKLLWGFPHFRMRTKREIT